MLLLEIPISPEGWDEQKEEFVEAKTQLLQLEHSLVSLSKWESKWHKPFLHSDKTEVEILDYIKCMTLTENVDSEIYKHLSRENIAQINNYIDDPMSATTFSDDKTGKRNREIVTSEIIYYWMFSSGIPLECQEWHLNRLITLIRVFGIKNAPPDKKRSQKDLASHYAALNKQRRAQMNTKG